MVARHADSLVPVVFARDADSAQRYVDVLERAGIEAHVRIEDGAHLAPAGSAYGAITSGEPFVYPVLVSRLQRRVARRALEGVSTASEAAPVTGSSVAGVAAFVLGAMALVAVAAWLRGDL